VTTGQHRFNGGKASEHFAAIPFRVDVALAADELTFGQAGLLCCLVYRCRRDGGESPFTLRALKAEMRWPWGPEQLRRDLHALAPDWVHLTPPPNGKDTWRVRLTGADLHRDSASPVEGVSTQWSHATVSSPHTGRVAGTAPTPPGGAHTNDRREERRGKREETVSSKEEPTPAPLTRADIEAALGSQFRPPGPVAKALTAKLTDADHEDAQ
jgi:hypothetical protein